VRAYREAPNERNYWSELWIELKSSIQDSLFDYCNFWYLPSTFIWDTAKMLNKQHRQKINATSYSTAALADAVSRVLFTNYKGTPNQFLPYPQEIDQPIDPGQPEPESQSSIKLSNQTIQILLTEIEKKRLPIRFVAQISDHLPKWKTQIE
jgi:hypothetical protein